MQFIYSLTVTIYKVLTLPNFGWKKKEKYLPAENVLQSDSRLVTPSRELICAKALRFTACGKTDNQTSVSSQTPRA
ncbi:hypothetical protein M8J76_015418 [Diaphorina citri]|nr:hypothetical protein M8J76_015418 [Diaphorina citri]